MAKSLGQIAMEKYGEKYGEKCWVSTWRDSPEALRQIWEDIAMAVVTENHYRCIADLELTPDSLMALLKTSLK